jgi:FlaA1/EpsC-like NDP-sugar epimerase
MEVTAVEYLFEQINDALIDFTEGKISASIYGIRVTEYKRLAKEMEKEQIIVAINQVSENNVKYANMIIASWSQIEGELFMHNTKLAEQYYNETYGKAN